ncbi:hypothetical protein D3C80_1737980 [compost metagenome]
MVNVCHPLPVVSSGDWGFPTTGHRMGQGRSPRLIVWAYNPTGAATACRLPITCVIPMVLAGTWTDKPLKYICAKPPWIGVYRPSGLLNCIVHTMSSSAGILLL